MNSHSSYRPGFFISLIKSCSDGDFYHRIIDIRLLRAIGFLLLLSLFLSIIALITLSLFWTQLFPTQEELLADYDRVFPSIEGSFDGKMLTTSPEQFSLYVGFDNSGKVLLSDEKMERNMIRLQIDSHRVFSENNQEAPQVIGAYLYQDGVYFVTGIQNQFLSYEDLEFDKKLSFTKDQLKTLIESGYPVFQAWMKKSFLITIPIMIFVYFFISSWLLAIFFSFFGMMILLIMKKPIDYFFLIRLSFYTSVPALLVTFITALFSISVSFVPLFVYLAYYYYGLMGYKANSQNES